MKNVVLRVVCFSLLAGCTAANFDGRGIAPISGSITYNGQPHTKLTKSPVGSTFPHDFTDQWGRQVEETYIIRPDRSLAIVDRQYRPDIFGDD